MSAYLGTIIRYLSLAWIPLGWHQSRNTPRKWMVISYLSIPPPQRQASRPNFRQPQMLSLRTPTMQKTRVKQQWVSSKITVSWLNRHFSTQFLTRQKKTLNQINNKLRGINLIREMRNKYSIRHTIANRVLNRQMSKSKTNLTIYPYPHIGLDIIWIQGLIWLGLYKVIPHNKLEVFPGDHQLQQLAVILLWVRFNRRLLMSKRICKRLQWETTKR